MPIVAANLLTDAQELLIQQSGGGETTMMRSLSMGTSFVPDTNQTGNPLGSSQAKCFTPWRMVNLPEYVAANKFTLRCPSSGKPSVVKFA
jgi:hypothetical protein